MQAARLSTSKARMDPPAASLLGLALSRPGLKKVGVELRGGWQTDRQPALALPSLHHSWTAPLPGSHQMCVIRGGLWWLEPVGRLKFCTKCSNLGGHAVRPAVRIDNSLRCTRALPPARYDSRVRQHQGAQISDGHDCTPRCCVMSGPSGAAPLLKTSSMHRTALFRRGRGLLGGLRRAPPGVPASSAGSSDFHTEQHKLLAGLNYQTKFQHNFAGNPEEYESDLVKGCKVVSDGRAYRDKRCARGWRTVPGNCQHCAVLEDAVGRVSACIYVPCCDCRQHRRPGMQPGSPGRGLSRPCPGATSPQRCRVAAQHLASCAKSSTRPCARVLPALHSTVPFM